MKQILGEERTTIPLISLSIVFVFILSINLYLPLKSSPLQLFQVFNFFNLGFLVMVMLNGLLLLYSFVEGPKTYSRGLRLIGITLSAFILIMNGFSLAIYYLFQTVANFPSQYYFIATICIYVILLVSLLSEGWLPNTLTITGLIILFGSLALFYIMLFNVLLVAFIILPALLLFAYGLITIGVSYIGLTGQTIHSKLEGKTWIMYTISLTLTFVIILVVGISMFLMSSLS